MAVPLHPYWPPTAIITGYVPNATPVPKLLTFFGAIIVAVVATTLWKASKSSSSLPLRRVDYFGVAWFSLCGFLHVAFEGYYLYHRDELASMGSPFAELWKEYALSDSRYLTNDVFTVSVETITAFIWGPLCWYIVLTTIQQSFAPRHVAQVIACTAHLYGVALYYLTNWNEYRFHGTVHSRPEFLYFWVYYAGFNLPWAVVPFYFLMDSYRQVRDAFGVLEVLQRNRKQS